MIVNVGNHGGRMIADRDGIAPYAKSICTEGWCSHRRANTDSADDIQESTRLSGRAEPVCPKQNPLCVDRSLSPPDRWKEQEQRARARARASTVRWTKAKAKTRRIQMHLRPVFKDHKKSECHSWHGKFPQQNQ